MLGAQLMLNNKINPFTMCSVSERLRQAGIKESKSKSELSVKKNNSRKREPHIISKSYSKKYTKQRFLSARKTEKLQSPTKSFVLQYSEISHQNEENPAFKNLSGFCEDLNENAEPGEKETISVSLDFIEDCQNYKKRIRTPRGDSEKNNQWKGSRNSVSNQKPIYSKKEELSKKQEGSKTDKHSDNRNNETTRHLEKKLLGNEDLKNPIQSKKLKKRSEKKLFEAFPCVEPFFNKMDSDDIAKIDKKYLNSLISIAINKKMKASKSDVKKQMSREEQEVELNKNLSENKKKISGKAFFERKVNKNKEMTDGYLICLSEKRNSDIENKEAEIQDAAIKNGMRTRTFRDLAKSEEKLQTKTEKLTENYMNSKMKDKNATLSKPDINGSRKKRKLTNKYLKNNNEEFIETSFPSEVSNVADVKELWRRNAKKKSENSLSSHSSCTVPECNEFSTIKNLDSYKFLKKLVEEEINNIIKTSVNKNIGKEEGEENSSKGAEQTKSICQILKQSPSEKSKPIKSSQIPALKKKLAQTESSQLNLASKGKEKRSQLQGFLAEDIPNEANPNFKLLEKKAKDGVKIPSQVIESWSILDRLEKAFLALGTPTFPTNKNEPTKPTSYDKKITTGAQKLQREKSAKETKNLQKTKTPITKKRKDSATSQVHDSLDKDPWSKPRISQNKKIETNKINILKEKHMSNKLRKESNTYLANRLENLQLNYLRVSKNKENYLKKKISQIQSPDPVAKKNSLRKMPKVQKKKTNDTTPQKVNQSRVKSPKDVLWNSKENKNSDKPLERKPTFSVIPSAKPSSDTLRETKSWSKNRFLQNLIQANKNQTEENLKDDVSLRSENAEKSTGIKLTSRISSKKLIKNPGKDKLVRTSDKPKSAEEKKFTKKNSANGVNCTAGRNKNEALKKSSAISQFHTENDKASSTTKDSQDLENNSGDSSLKVRPVKKRSILSLRVNPNCNEAHQILMRIQENSGFRVQDKSNNIPNNINILLLKENENFPETSSQSFMASNTEDKEASSTKTDVEPTPTKIQEPVNSNHKNRLIAEEKSNPVRSKPLWEQDLTHYHAIVKEIMSQYKRIDGFLKQSGKSNQFSHDSSLKSNKPEDTVTITTKATSTADATSIANITPSSKNSSAVNIYEYRKKIISEYQALPIFEYKHKLLENAKENSDSKNVRKTLSVVKDYESYVDVDVKDYQPKVKKILNSQLYVEPAKLSQKIDPKLKFQEKKTSLQDLSTEKNEKMADKDESLRSFSAAETFLQTDSVTAATQILFFNSPLLESNSKQCSL